MNGTTKIMTIAGVVAMLAGCGVTPGGGQGGVNINICNLADTDGGCTQSGTNSNVSQTAIDGDAVDDATREAADLARDILGIEGAENPPPGGGTPPPGGGTPPPGGGGTLPNLILSAQFITPTASSGVLGGSGTQLRTISGYGMWNLPASLALTTSYDLAPLVFAAGNNGTVIRWAPGGDETGNGGPNSDNPLRWVRFTHATVTGPSSPASSYHDYRAVSVYGYKYEPDEQTSTLVTSAVAAGTSIVPDQPTLTVRDGIFVESEGGSSSVDWSNPADPWRVTDSSLPAMEVSLTDAQINGVWAIPLKNPATTDSLTWRILVGGDTTNGGGIIVHQESQTLPSGSIIPSEDTNAISSVTFNAIHGHIGEGGLISAYAVGKTVSGGTGAIYRLKENYTAGSPPPPASDWVAVTLPTSPLGPITELTSVYVASANFVIAVSTTGQLVICESENIATPPPSGCQWRVEKPMGTVELTSIYGVWAPEIAQIYTLLGLDNPPTRYYPFYLIAVASGGKIFRSSYFDLASEGAWEQIPNAEIAQETARSDGFGNDSGAISTHSASLTATAWKAVWSAPGSKADPILPQYWVDSFLVGDRTGSNSLLRIREELPLAEIVGDQALLELIVTAVQ